MSSGCILVLKNTVLAAYFPIKEAFKSKLIDNEILLDMLEDRNLSSHIYNENISKKIFERIKNIYVDYLDSLNLKEKL